MYKINVGTYEIHVEQKPDAWYACYMVEGKVHVYGTGINEAEAIGNIILWLFNKEEIS